VGDFEAPGLALRGQNIAGRTFFEPARERVHQGLEP
jgi:hypothetical protein